MIDSPGAVDATAGQNSNILILPLPHAVLLTILLVVSMLFGVGGALMGGIALSRTSDVSESVAAARQSAVDAARAEERANVAERSAGIAKEFAVQVYPELNRLGYPVNTPFESHEHVQDEAYEALDKFAEAQP